jgi:sugar phosphate isomerase/epimerase
MDRCAENCSLKMRDLSTDNRFLSINTTTVREQGDLGQIIAALGRAEIPGIAPWRDQTQAFGVKETARHIKAAGLEVSGYCRGGWFTSKGRAGFQAAVDDNKRAIDEAVEIGAQCLVMVSGGLIENSHDLGEARNIVRDGLAAVLAYARSAGLPLAIEPLHPMHCAERCCVNTLAQANDLCDELGEGAGIALDVYHVWWDPDLEGQVRRAGKDRLHAFHICDWLAPTKDPLYDRGMMGDGVIDIPSIRRLVESVGYDGFCEVEILSRAWWQRPMHDVFSTCIERYRSVC